MARYLLKHYVRDNPNSSVGKLESEWAILAQADSAAIQLAEVQLSAIGFQLPADFAILWDATGKVVWERVADA